MPPIPKPQVPGQFDSDEEESLLILASDEKKWYSSLFEKPNHSEDATETTSDSDIECRLADSEEGGTQRISHLRRVWEAYYGALERWPLVVKSVTAFVLMALADFLAQMVEHLRGIPYGAFVNVLRTLRFGVFGLLGAPWTHYYYDWLDRTLPPTPQPWTMTTAGKISHVLLVLSIETWAVAY